MFCIFFFLFFITIVDSDGQKEVKMDIFITKNVSGQNVVPRFNQKSVMGKTILLDGTAQFREEMYTCCRSGLKYAIANFNLDIFSPNNG